MRMDYLKDPLAHSNAVAMHAYLNVNPEATLLHECQDIIEELHMMSQIFTQQSQVVKDFGKELDRLNEKEERKHESSDTLQRKSGALDSPLWTGQYKRVPRSTILNAGEVYEPILERRAEIDELEEAAIKTSQQVCPVSSTDLSRTDQNTSFKTFLT